MIELVPFTEEHFSYLKKWINSASEEKMIVWSGITFNFPLTDEQLSNYIKHANLPGSDSFVFTVINRNTGLPAGHCALRKIDYIHRSARIGKLLIGDESNRGQGWTPSIFSDLLTFAFENLSLHRVALGVFDGNSRARHIYEKYGFFTEGYFRDYRIINGKFTGMYEMSLLKHEWRLKYRHILADDEKISNKFQQYFR